MPLSLSASAFRECASKGYNRVPLLLPCSVDLDTPLSLYLKLANQPYSFLLESVIGGERFGRYSYIGLPAKTVLRSTVDGVQVETEGRVVETYTGNPLDFVERYAKRFRVAPSQDSPRFCGGLAGYFAYDIARYIEPRLNLHGHQGPVATDAFPARQRAQKADPTSVPDILLLLTEELLIIDNLTTTGHLMVYADPSLPNTYERACERLLQLQQRISQPLSPQPSSSAQASSELQRLYPKADFLKAVARAKEYVAAGDVMQVQLGQLIKQPFPQSPLSLYRVLRRINPSPYMYFYHFEAFHVVGASPEILVRQDTAPDGGQLTIRPLAGTRRRGRTLEEDEALAQELLADPKEIAEHVMLIDLARNDLGRIAQSGTVRVTEQFRIEKYSHVMHIVSNVEAKPKPGTGPMDVLRATFPAGTLSGAPKIRAMEIIEELEPTRRGVYGGACGYLSFSGTMDLAITIRTALIKDNFLYVQAAAGIVADSVPELEWQETENKVKAIVRAAEMAQTGEI